MLIRTSDREIEVKSILGESVKSGSHQYPALKIDLPAAITDEDIASLLTGSFTIVDPDGNEYVHEGYNTLKEISVSIIKVTSDESEIQDLESQLAAIRAEIDAANTELETTKHEVNTARAELETAQVDRDAAKAELETAKVELETVKAANVAYQEEIQTLEAENAELLFNNLTK